MCMIARDSARTLRAALDSIRPWVDEMVVVDTGSRDDTPAIAAACGARIGHFAWCDDFAAARNESLSLATGDWVFWMDSDDTIDAANGQALRALADTDHPPARLGFILQVQCPVPEGASDHASAIVVDHVKLLRNDPRLRFTGRIHEQILPAIRHLGGEVDWTSIVVQHSGSDQTEAGRRRKRDRDLRLLQLELADHPDDSFALFNLGMTLLDAGELEPALLQLCRSLQLSEPGESHVRKIHALLVQAYSELGRPETALKTCRAGLAVFPDDLELNFRHGVLAQRQGRLAEAEQAFRAVLAPRQGRYLASVDAGMFGVKAWHNLALLHETAGRPDAAAAAWLEVIERDSGSMAGWWGLLTAAVAAPVAVPRVPDGARFDLVSEAAAAVEALAAGRADEALLRLEASMNRAAATSETPPGNIAGEPPDNGAPATSARVGLAAGSATADPAAGSATAGTAANGAVGPLRDLACRVAFRCAAWDTAERWLQALLRTAPNDASAWLNLAVARFQCGRYAAALQAVQRSLTIRPGHPAAERLRADAERRLVSQPDH
jgi:tetratricopeptide (TPR) repeat protein